MKQRALLGLLVCGCFIFLMSPAKSAGLALNSNTPVTPLSNKSAASPRKADKTDKYAAAIISLHKRIATLEQTTQAQTQIISQQSTTITALQQQISGLKGSEDFDRQTLQTLTTRLNYIDGKTKTVTFPTN